MAMFFDWMMFRDAATLLRLLETAAYFDPVSYNAVFDAELNKMLGASHDPSLRQQVASLRGFDWGNYIARSLARAGFKDDDQQEALHGIVVRLLVDPGKLFRTWEPGRHGPLDRRFKRSVWNAIRNLAEKDRNRRRWMKTADPSVIADRFAGRTSDSNLVEQFRKLVSERLGALALAVLDSRLAGRESKELVGRGQFEPSAYLIKREVAAIKRLATEFANRTGDPAFAKMVTAALEAEGATIAKRQRALAARHAG
jgi:hypothetical protein